MDARRARGTSGTDTGGGIGATGEAEHAGCRQGHPATTPVGVAVNPSESPTVLLSLRTLSPESGAREASERARRAFRARSSEFRISHRTRDYTHLYYPFVFLPVCVRLFRAFLRFSNDE